MEKSKRKGFKKAEGGKGCSKKQFKVISCLVHRLEHPRGLYRGCMLEN